MIRKHLGWSLFAAGCIGLTGCAGFTGPVAPRGVKVDQPWFTTEEQRARARSKTAVADETYLGGPPSAMFHPGVYNPR